MEMNTAILGSAPKRKPGRPPYGISYDAQILFRLPGELRRQVEARAQAEDMTLSLWIRRSLRAQLRRKVSR
jgi:hypothetical protein